MKTTEAIRRVLEATDTSAYRVSNDLGKVNNYVGNIYNRGTDVKSSTLAKIIGACGYSLVCVPDEVAGNLEDDRCFKVDGE